MYRELLNASQILSSWIRGNSEAASSFQLGASSTELLGNIYPFIT